MSMTRNMSRCGGIVAGAALLLAASAYGQDLVITNGRILDGTGRVIERGSVVVRDGRIAAVTAGAPSSAGGRTIDAGGKTVMPGFIDAHRHLIEGDPQRWLTDVAPAQMREFIEAGFTTVLSAGDPPQILEARRMLQEGELEGPRLFAGMFVSLAGPTGPRPPGDPARSDASRTGRPTQAAPAIPREQTIAAVENAARAGYDYLKNVIVVSPGGPEVDTLKLVIEEGKKGGLPTITHAVSVQDTLAAVEAGPAVLVHTPHIGHLTDEDVRTIVSAGIPMTSTLAVFLPHFDEDNRPLFRDGQPFPWNTLTSAGDGPVNARLLWEGGIVSYGYGTDTQWPPKQSLADELRALSLVFSPRDIVTIMTKNAAASALKSDEIGTLEPGKLADIVIVDGDPLADTDALLNVVTTIKGGEVLFEAGR
ncbi:MAG TPA: amidohydrolase family protein [Gammaproteobacteria bacterium]